MWHNGTKPRYVLYVSVWHPDMWQNAAARSVASVEALMGRSVAEHKRLCASIMAQQTHPLFTTFTRYDRTKSNSLSRDEVKEMMEALGYKASKIECEHAVSSCARTHLCTRAMLRCMTLIPRMHDVCVVSPSGLCVSLNRSEVQEGLDDVFGQFDTDYNRVIDIDEFSALWAALGGSSKVPSPRVRKGRRKGRKKKDTVEKKRKKPKQIQMDQCCNYPY